MGCKPEIRKNFMKACHLLQASSEIIGKNRHCSGVTGMTKSTQHGMMAAPRQLSIDEVIAQLDDPTLAVLDTRADRAGFMKTHLPGSLYAPPKAVSAILRAAISDRTKA